MIYPVRSLRHKQQREKAVVTLLLRYKSLYLQRINQKRYPAQKRTIVTNHVRFSGPTIVCEYNAEDIPAEAIIRRPSRINQISERVLKEEAKRNQIDTSHKSPEMIQRLVCKKWVEQMRADLSKYSIATKSLKDEEIESCYNLFLGLKRGANLQMAEVTSIPRSMSLPELQHFLSDHRLSCQSPSSRLCCIACAENYLLDSLPPIESVMSDIARKRFSVEDIFIMKYPFHSLPLLQQHVISRGIHPVKTVSGCRKLLMDCDSKLLELQFSECLKDTLGIMLKSYNIKPSRRINTDFLQLYQQLKDETIPEVFE